MVLLNTLNENILFVLNDKSIFIIFLPEGRSYNKLLTHTGNLFRKNLLLKTGNPLGKNLPLKGVC